MAYSARTRAGASNSKSLYRVARKAITRPRKGVKVGFRVIEECRPERFGPQPLNPTPPNQTTKDAAGPRALLSRTEPPSASQSKRSVWEFPKIGGALFVDPCDKDPTI